MRSARATIGRSFEPWAAARSKRGRPRAQRQSAVDRPARLRSLPPADRPPCAPTASASMPASCASSRVCAKSRAVTSTSWPAARNRCTSGRKTTGWAGAERSIQILIGTSPPGALLAPAECALDGGQPVAVLARVDELLLEPGDVRDQGLRRIAQLARDAGSGG